MNPTASPLRWGILGTGRVLGKFGPAFARARGVQLRAIASRDPDRARGAAAQHGAARAYGSYAELLADPEVDVVLNALPNGLHCEWTVRALEAGKHVLCEKPLARSCAEVERMFAAAHAHRHWLLEGLMYRFHPQLAAVHQRLAAGDIGQLRLIRTSYARPALDPGNFRYQVAAGGGALLDLGCYCVDFARCFAGREPVRVTAHAHFSAETGVDLTLAGALDFGAGLSAQFVCGFEMEGVFAAELHGTAGRIQVPHPWLPPAWPAEFDLVRGGRAETLRVTPPEVPAHALVGFISELEHFSDCIRNGRAPCFPPGIDAEQNSRANSRTLDALRAAARARTDAGSTAGGGA